MDLEMGLQMVLNELSLESPAHNVEIANQRMSDLISTIQAARSLGVTSGLLYTYDNILGVLLAPHYPLVRWSNHVDEDIRRFFYSLLTHDRLLVDIINERFADKNGKCEFFYGKDKAIGLGSAHLLDALAISISSTVWPHDHLQLNVRELDDQCEIVDGQPVEVTHASCEEHVKSHGAWIKERLTSSINDGVSLWGLKDVLFPHLEFCPVVKDQLRKVLRGSQMLEPVIKTLLKLERYSKDWHDGAFNHRQIACTISPESEATRQQFKQERTFDCPNGEERTFDWHAKVTPENWRIYLDPWADKRRRLIIGYIGPHLPTAKYP